MPKLVRKKINLVSILGDGAIGNPEWADGRLIPLIIFDNNNQKILEDLIIAHKDIAIGDVTSIWGWKMFSNKEVFLTLDFHSPIETSATLVFNVTEQGDLVDWIINARGLYLQPLSSGTKVIEGLFNPKILIEIPPESTFPKWKKIYRESKEKHLIKRGLSRKEAKKATKEVIQRLHEFQFRKQQNK